MKKMTLAVIILTFTFFGCAAVDKIGDIGGHEIYKVTTRDLIAPSSTTLLTLNKADNGLTRIEGGVGASMLGQVAGPAAVAGAGYFIGRGIGDSGDENRTENNTSISNTNSTAAGINVPDRGPINNRRWYWQFFDR